MLSFVLQAKVPKGSMQVDRINVCFAAEKLCREFGLQIMYTLDSGRVRNIYVSAQTGEVCLCY